jgi:hypothetical protein
VVKKGLIAVAVFYLLGVLGVAGGYLSNTWEGEWSVGVQLVEALRIGASWPLLVIELVTGA